MKKVLLIVTLLLTACGREYVPVKGVVPPPLPPQLSKKAKALPPVTDRSLGGLIVASAQDTQAYNAVASQLNSLIDVYDCVRLAIDKNTDVKNCLK